MTTEVQLFGYDQATTAAWEVIRSIEGHFDRIEICGGLRRKKESVHDIDLVCLPTDRFSINIGLGSVCTSTHPTAEKITFNCRGIPGEIFFVQSEQEFDVMKLERTGDFAFTKALAQAALTKGLVFRFSKDKGYYKIPMYGLYKITGTWWDEQADRAHRKHYLIGDMIHPICYKEDEVIETIFNRSIPPKDRSWYESGNSGESPP